MWDEGYGSTHREKMMKILEQPAGEWRPTNRRVKRDNLDVASFVVGVLTTILVGAVIVAQLQIKFHIFG